ncbi:MAG: hypothetical protein ABL998_13945 [Planctomycetota bacterium]
MLHTLIVGAFLIAPQPQASFAAGRSVSPHAFSPQVTLETSPLSFTSPWSGMQLGSKVTLLPAEGASGVDLNLDGDRSDTVAYSYDLATSQGATLGMWSTFQDIGLTSYRLGTSGEVWLVPENGGPAGDENEDGDVSDRILYALKDGVARSSGLPALGIAWDDSVALSVSEWRNGNVDLNGDGRISEVLFLWDLASGLPPQNSGIEIYELVAAGGDHVMATLNENITMVDENGDGDTSDSVLLVVHAPTGSVHPARLCGFEAQMSGSHGQFLVSETSQGADLNGDGDLDDALPFVFDGDTGLLSNLGLAASLNFLFAPFGGHVTAPTLEQGVFAFSASEFAHGGIDLNGDGDALDDVLHVYFPETGELRNLGLATWSFAFDREHLVFQASETGQGVDLDGSGAVEDYVWQVHELLGNSTWNTRLTLEAPWFTQRLFNVSTLHAREVAVVIGSPAAQELVVLDARARRVTKTGLRVRSAGFVESGLLIAQVSEPASGRDLSGDGDALDAVLHFVLPGLGHILNTGASVDFVAAAFRNTVGFFVFEQAEGRDLNGDGDVRDSLFRTARLSL